MKEQKERFYWVDIAKAIGIFLIYYAHLLQRAYRLSPDAVFFQYKFTYAFHLPLFFFISGFFYKNKELPKLKQIGILFQKRIFPVFLFVLLTFTVSIPYQYLKFGKLDSSYYLDNLIYLIQGKPNLNATLWFLVCLWLVEIWALMVLPTVKTSLQGILLSSFFLYFGYVWTAIPEQGAFYLLPKNFWYLHESLVAFGFYAAGYVSFKWVGELLKLNIFIRVALTVFLFGVVYWAAQMNSPYQEFVMVMKASEHGVFFFFLLAAFTGIFATLLLASLLSNLKWLAYIGRNTLILLGMNGLFMSFFNSHIMDWLKHYDSAGWVIFDSIWLSLATITISIPVIELLNRYLPQFIGRPQVDGPILKAFAPLEFHFLGKLVEKLSSKLGAIR